MIAALGKYRKSSLAASIFSTVLCWGLVTLAQSSNTQPIPERETFNYLNQKYSLFIGKSRDACRYYVDPNDIYQEGNSRVTMVKVSAEPRGTVMTCQGVLQFVLLQVNCQTKDVAYSKPSGSTNLTWMIERDIDSEVAQTVCSLPARQTE